MKHEDRRNKLILIVDDDSDIRNYARELLETSGYRTLCATSGKEAIKVLHAETPDLILMDLNMPEMGGFEAVRVLRERTETRAIPVLIFTDQLEKEKILEARELEVKGYIAKPLNIKTFLEKVTAALQ